MQANYATRINTLLSSWKKANHGEGEDDTADMASSDLAEMTGRGNAAGQAVKQAANSKGTSATLTGALGFDSRSERSACLPSPVYVIIIHILHVWL